MRNGEMSQTKEKLENMLYVEIVNTKTDEVVKRMGPMSERKAEKVESGASINLNHEEYHTRIVQGCVTNIVMILDGFYQQHTTKHNEYTPLVYFTHQIFGHVLQLETTNGYLIILWLYATNILLGTIKNTKLLQIEWKY
jgi:hypothetical protein